MREAEVKNYPTKRWVPMDIKHPYFPFEDLKEKYKPILDKIIDERESSG